MNRTLRTLVGAIVVSLSGSDAWAQTTAQINGTVADAAAASCRASPSPLSDRHRLPPGSRDRRQRAPTRCPTCRSDRIASKSRSSGFRTYAQTGIVLQVNSNPVIPVTLQLGASRKRSRSKPPRRSSRRATRPSARSSTTKQVEALPLEGRNAAVARRAGRRRGGYRQPVEPQPDEQPRHRRRRRPAVRRGVPARRRDAQQRLRRRQPAAAVPRRDAGVPRRDQLAERAERLQGRRHGRRRHQGGHQPVPRRRVRVRAPSQASTRRARLRRSTGPPASASTTAWCGTSSAACSAGRSCRTSIFFFGAYQGTRATQTPADIVTFIPTAAMLAGDFSTVASAQCRAQGNLTLPAALGFVNNRINPALLSPAAVKIARHAAHDDRSVRADRVFAARPSREENQPIGRVDCAAHARTTRCSRATCCRRPSGIRRSPNSPGQHPAAGARRLGGRDNSQHSLVVGDTMVLSNTVVNNIRVSVNRTSVRADARRHVRPRRRRHQDVHLHSRTT